MSTIRFTNSAGLASFHPEAPPEVRGMITDYGFPTVLKRMHMRLKACFNRIPKGDPGGPSLRDQFLQCIAMDLSDQSIVDKLCNKLGFSTAQRDLLEKRISEMQPIDFIVDKKLATPDQASVSEVRNVVLREDRERFARVNPQAGQRTDEWDVMSAEDDGPAL